MDPPTTLDRIALLMSSLGQPSFRSRVFTRAAGALRRLEPGAVVQLAAEGRLQEIEGVGPVVERIVLDVLDGGRSAYLDNLERDAEAALLPSALDLMSALRGDCHVHSDWSDGRSPIPEMALTAYQLQHEYVALTDHSPSLTIARGLSPERLREQLSALASLNAGASPLPILSGIEVDILEDGALDQEEVLLDGLDVVVGSVHSKLRMEPQSMTPRLLRALADPRLDILGHCTGRLITGRGRPESQFDPAAIFAACAQHDKAIEINCRPERLDPPRRLLRLAVEAGCKFAINTDAHTPSELHWQRLGCQRAAECGVRREDVVNTWPRERLLSWTAAHRRA